VRKYGPHSAARAWLGGEGAASIASAARHPPTPASSCARRVDRMTGLAHGRASSDACISPRPRRSGAFKRPDILDVGAQDALEGDALSCHGALRFRRRCWRCRRSSAASKASSRLSHSVLY
jgi:hypothetical protein